MGTVAIWVSDAEALSEPSDVLHHEQIEGNHVYISFQAAEAFGSVIHTILMSPCVTYRLKKELLGMALSALKCLEQREHLAPLAALMRTHLIKLYGFELQSNYLNILKKCFDEQDHALRIHLRRFSEELDRALAERP